MIGLERCAAVPRMGRYVLRWYVAVRCVDLPCLVSSCLACIRTWCGAGAGAGTDVGCVGDGRDTQIHTHVCVHM